MKVQFDSLHVTQAESFGFFGEPGSSAEWTLEIDVNGIRASYSWDVVTDGSNFLLGWSVLVPATTLGASLRITTWGYEWDSPPGDLFDSLPVGVRTYTAAESWGVGTSGALQATDQTDFNYTVHYTISCADAAPVSVITKTEMLSAVNTFAPASMSTMSDSQTLTLFIRSLGRRGMRFVRFDGDMGIFEGAGTVHQAADAAFRRRRRPSQR